MNNNLAMAAKLAAGLQEGEPCPVCGSGHHPARAAIQAHYADQAERDRLEGEIASAGETASALAVALRQTEGQVVGAKTQLHIARERVQGLERQLAEKVEGLTASWGVDGKAADIEALAAWAKDQERQINQTKEKLSHWQNERKAAELRCREYEQKVAAAKNDVRTQQAAQKVAQLELDRTNGDLAALTQQGRNFVRRNGGITYPVRLCRVE